MKETVRRHYGWELFSSGGTEPSWGRLVRVPEGGGDIELGCKVKQLKRENKDIPNGGIQCQN